MPVNDDIQLFKSPIPSKDTPNSHHSGDGEADEDDSDWTKHVRGK
jgi:hypothetical protein